MSRKIVDFLKTQKEGHGFLRGMVAFIGFSQSYILYERDARFKGSGKYNRYTGSIRIGLNGLLSYSTKPIFFITLMGLLMLFVSMILLVINYFYGFSLIVVLLFLLNGINLICLGLIGEYIGRVYDEVKHRPMYIIDRKYNFEN